MANVMKGWGLVKTKDQKPIFVPFSGTQMPFPLQTGNQAKANKSSLSPENTVV